MKDRIKKIRKELDLTQQEFADRIGIKRGGVANYESGRNEPIDAVISLICREFNVNENWLRTGNGEMFRSTDRHGTIAKFMEQLLLEESGSFKNRLISVLADLNVTEWEILERRMQQLFTDSRTAMEKPINTDHPYEELAPELSPDQMTVEELEEEYIKSRSNSARKTMSFASNTTEESMKKKNA